MAEDKGSKTEKPTSHRLTNAKNKGDIPRSKEAVSTITMLSGLFFFMFSISAISKSIKDLWQLYFRTAAERTLSIDSFIDEGKSLFAFYIHIMVPFFIVLIAAVFLMEILHGGGIRIIRQNLKVKFDKLNFIKGLKRILLSLETLFELIKSIVKVGLMGTIAYWSIKNDIPGIYALPDTSLDHILNVMGWVFLKLVASMIFFMIILSALDFMWQKYRYMKKLKMSKNEIKDEYKQFEGDPKIKGKQKQLQYQKAMKRMMAEVPKADVVITNPDHYAVALKYEFKKMNAPILVAKGKNLIAEKIKAVARENRVPIVENPPVARAIFAGVEINQSISAELFKPVAEILAYIYKLKGKKVG